MIYYHPDCDLKFSDYGIEIPIVDDRAYKVFHSLKSLHPELHYTDLSSLELVTRQDLERVHTAEFVEHLYGSNDTLKEEMLKRFGFNLGAEN